MLKVGIDWSFEADMLHIPSSRKGELTWYIVNIFFPTGQTQNFHSHMDS